MALNLTHKENQFSVGDTVKVHQKISEGEKTRSQIFEGMVIAIKNRDTGKSFTVRRVGSQKIGIEAIFPILSPNIEKVEVVRKGVEGVRHAKLYYTRSKSNREVEKIYSRIISKEKARALKPKKKVAKKVTKAKTAKKSSSKK